MRRKKTELTRREVLRLGAGGLGLLAISHLPGRARAADSPTVLENAKPGTTAWQLTNPAMNRQIEGYASLTSVNRGGTIQLYVSTTASSYTIEVYRMGWYGGAGGRLVHGPVTRPGVQQPMPQPDGQTGMIECAWTSPYSLTIPASAGDPTDWCSGVYLAKLTASGGGGAQSYIMFVVRDDARPSALLFQSSVTTFQAYNTWGGKCLYQYLSPTGKSDKVSFNRPYARNTARDDLAYGVGAAEFLIGGDGGPPAGWEYCMVRFLEREGYDVTYCTNVDTHESVGRLLSHSVFLSVGHDEYWSYEMRQNVISARDAGIGLGFFSANTCYWQVRFEPSPLTGAPNRTLVCYKYHPTDYTGNDTRDPLYADADPANDSRITVRWRDSLPASGRVALPEEMLLGTQYDYGADNANNDMVVVNAGHPVFTGTGLVNGSRLPSLVGYECDRVHGSAPPGTAILCHSPYTGNSFTGSGFSDMTMYTAPSGAKVFATGSIQWSWGLDDWGADQGMRYSRLNAAAQQMTRNALALLGAGPAGPPADTPIAVISTNVPGTVSVGVPVAFDGGSSHDPDGTIVGHAWNFGDGATATGVTAAHAYAAAGSYTVTLTVTDDDGATGSASAVVTVQPAVALASVTVAPTSVNGGASATGTATLTAAAPAGGVVVSLTSSHPTVASVPATVSIPAGATSATFAVTTVAPPESTTVAISGTYGGATKAATLSVLISGGVLSGLTLSTSSVVGGVTVKGTVTLSANAPAGGAVITLSSGNPAAAAVPASVTVLAGRKTATFNITTSPVAASTAVAITAGYRGATKTATLTVKPPALTSLVMSPRDVQGGNPSTGTVTLSGAAPSGGVTVALSSNRAQARVPASVTVPAGQKTATFTATTSVISGADVTATISGTFAGVTRKGTLILHSHPV